MTSRERVRKTLRFESPDRPPRDLWALPFVVENLKPEYEAILRRFPLDFENPGWTPGRTGRENGAPYKKGRFTDYWGVTFEAAEEGVLGEVREPLLADWRELSSFRLPWEYWKDANMRGIGAQCAASDKFMLAFTEVRPFERIQFLRGTENVFIDLAEGSPELAKLIAMIHEWELAAMETWSKTAVDAISFMDDWGSQNSLLISPETWREIFKPLYREYCEIARGAGKHVFFHSDGNIAAIYGDLVEIGVDAVNSQLFCMDIEELGRKYKGKITLWGELDRQRILPFGSPGDVRAAVRRVRQAFDTGRGGLIAQCEWGKITPRANIEAMYEEWNQ